MERLFAAALWVLALLGAGPVWAQGEVADCSRSTARGERFLCHEAVIEAPIDQVWALWTTSDGLRSWMAPVAAIDARSGGVMEASYDADGRIGDPANIQNRIVAFEPGRLLSIQVIQAPPNFPHAAEVMRLATRIEFEAVSEHATRVRVSMSGLEMGEAYQALYRHFAWGNAWTLNKLAERVTTAPVDWRAEANEAAQ